MSTTGGRTRVRATAGDHCELGFRTVPPIDSSFPRNFIDWLTLGLSSMLDRDRSSIFGNKTFFFILVHLNKIACKVKAPEFHFKPQHPKVIFLFYSAGCGTARARAPTPSRWAWSAVERVAPTGTNQGYSQCSNSTRSSSGPRLRTGGVQSTAVEGEEEGPRTNDKVFQFSIVVLFVFDNKE